MDSAVFDGPPDVFLVLVDVGGIDETVAQLQRLFEAPTDRCKPLSLLLRGLHTYQWRRFEKINNDTFSVKRICSA